MDDGSRSVLQNPVLIVLLGEWEKGVPDRLKKRFDFPESVVYVHVHSSDTATIQENGMIELCYGADWKWISEDEKKNRIIKALYLTKRQKYPEFNSVDICILKKGEDTDSILLQTVDLIMECTEAPFLGNLFLDIYCWVDERTVQESGSRLFEKEKALLRDRESVRFLFLLSQIDSEDVFLEKDEKLLELVMDSIMLLNFGHFPVYRQLNLKTSASGSKIYKLGSRKLMLDEWQEKRLFKYRLLKNIKEWGNGNSRENRNESLDLRELKLAVQGQVVALYHGLEGICSYEKNLRSLERKGTAALGYFFGNNHECFMELNKSSCMEKSLQFTRQFCRTQLPVYLNYMFEKAGGSFLREDDILDVKQRALEQCDKSLFSDGYSAERVVYPSKLKSRLLEQWGRQKILELMEEIYARCVQEVRDGICAWSRRLSAGREEFESSYQRMRYACIGIDTEKNSLRKQLVSHSTAMIDAYLQRHKSGMNGYEKLWRMATEGKMEKGSIEQLLEEQTELAYSEFLKDCSFFNQIDLVTEDIQERNKFYAAIYEEFLAAGKFQIRGHIPNEEVYSCYVGNLKDEFVKYVNQKQSEIMFCTDGMIEPQVLYYQNVKDFIQLSAYEAKGRSR